MRVGLLALTGLLFTAAALAESDFEALVAETGIRPGDTPVREAPRWQSPARVVVRGTEETVAELAAAVPSFELIPAPNLAAAIEAAADADAIVGYCNAELVEAAGKASWIQLFSAGAEYCVALGPVANGDIVLTNMQKMSSPVIGEHAMAMVLSLSRGLTQFAKLMPSGTWDRSVADSANVAPVADRTLLVVGLGGIGREVAKRAHALGMRVIATRNSSREGPDYVDYVGLSDELHELAARADVVVNALPLTPATDGLLDEAFFAAVKPGALYVSVGRGRTTVTSALIAALENGRLGGAGLDVTDPEPLPEDHPLWQFDNVLITPHMSGSGGGTARHRLLIRQNLERFARGDALYNVVEPTRGY